MHDGVKGRAKMVLWESLRYGMYWSMILLGASGIGIGQAQRYDIDASGYVYRVPDSTVVNGAVLEMMTSSETVFAETGPDGSFHVHLSTDVDDQDDIVPEDYKLDNYPNPFNNATHIRGSYDVRGFNVTGQEIPVDVSYGSQGTRITMRRFAAGVYFFLLTDKVTGEKHVLKALKSGHAESITPPVQMIKPMSRKSVGETGLGPYDVLISATAEAHFPKDTTLENVISDIEGLDIYLTQHPEAEIEAEESFSDSTEAIVRAKGRGAATLEYYLEDESSNRAYLGTRAINLSGQDTVSINGKALALGKYQLVARVAQTLNGETFEDEFKSSIIDFLGMTLEYTGPESFDAREGSNLVISPKDYFTSNMPIDSAWVELPSSAFTQLNDSTFAVSNSGKGQYPITLGAIAEDRTEKQKQAVVVVKEQRLFRAYILNNQMDDDGDYNPIVGNVEVFYDGKSNKFRTDENGFLEVQFPVDFARFDSVKVNGVDAGPDTLNTFIQTYRDMPMAEDWETPAGLMVTTWDRLVNNVDPAYEVSPELFRTFVQEGVTGYISGGGGKLRGILFQNAQNPVPNPNGDHGYVYWIDSDFYEAINAEKYGSFSKEQQEYVKRVIEERILSEIKEPSQRPNIYLAESGERPPLEKDPVTGEDRLASGLIYVVHQNGGNGYSFGWDDYEKDGIGDVCKVGVGDPPNLDGPIAEEAGSIIIPNNINNDALKGKTIQSSGGSTGFLAPADLKVLGIQQNMNPVEWKEYTTPSGLSVIKGNYKPLTHINDILGVR